MRRFLVALVVGGAVFGAVYGLAAGLGINSSTFGSGNSVVAACQSGTLTASFSTSYQSSIPGFRVDSVTFTGLDTTSSPTNCASKAYTVALTGSGNTSLGSASGTTPSSGTSFSVNVASANINEASVLGVHLTISG